MKEKTYLLAGTPDNEAKGLVAAHVLGLVASREVPGTKFMVEMSTMVMLDNSNGPTKATSTGDTLSTLLVTADLTEEETNKLLKVFMGKLGRAPMAPIMCVVTTRHMKKGYAGTAHGTWEFLDGHLTVIREYENIVVIPKGTPMPRPDFADKTALDEEIKGLHDYFNKRNPKESAKMTLVMMGIPPQIAEVLAKELIDMREKMSAKGNVDILHIDTDSPVKSFGTTPKLTPPSSKPGLGRIQLPGELGAN